MTTERTPRRRRRDPLAEALSIGRAHPTAQYRVDLRTGEWWWSDEMYLLHGLAPGSVAPTAALLASHKHPDDRDAVLREVAMLRTTGRPFSCSHRIVDARGRTRTVTVTGQGRRDASGAVVEVVGLVVDSTAAHEDALRREVTRQVAVGLADRAVVDQAKGVLMATHGLDSDGALDLLVVHASESSRRLPDVARELLDALSVAGGLGEDAKDRADACLAALEPGSVSRVGGAQLFRRKGAAAG
ncbi:PAS and ANTAR domain-containing protein [Oerskovia enterophila]|uniref:histidine kinase n=1 Tax=Oerskovia enterophila TaxID=43678 RepID=A0A163SW25_9CELL|nr:PAS and ANTAR domain-containing protein [Oerskovia enterophila]KZM36820.1 putative diguanylate cyclase [Oerskovia enterophila]OCI29938.1 putative diguanylate cyclase [Oerskovia enterophila]